MTVNTSWISSEQDDNSMNVFAGEEQEISCDDPDLLLWLQKRIENLVRYRQRWGSNLGEIDLDMQIWLCQEFFLVK